MDEFLFENITVISVTYQSESIIQELAKTLLNFKHVVIVDNASSDATLTKITKYIPHAKIIANASNLGFGAGNNIGVAAAHTEYALLLNPDCQISVDDVVKLVDAAVDYPSAGLIAPQGIDANGKNQPSYRHAFYEKRPRGPYHLPDGVCSARWLHGCCLLTRTDAFKKFGGFDTRFFLFFEDDDLCLKCIDSGFDCIVQPAATVVHLGGKSSTPSYKTDFLKQYHWARSKFQLINKYQGYPKALLYRVKIAVCSPFAILLFTLLGRKKYLIKWLAWACFAWALSGEKKERHFMVKEQL